MSACKTGCGWPVAYDSQYFCATCGPMWEKSKECDRWLVAAPAAGRVAVTDFCNRVRAESRPEVPRAD